MGKLKQALPEDIDITDGKTYDLAFLLSDHDDRTEQDVAIDQLEQALLVLKRTGGNGYMVELRTAKERLSEVINRTARPF